MLLNTNSLSVFLGMALLKLMLPAQAEIDISKLGIVEVMGEKQYFVENLAKVNYHRAMQICAAMNMTLASIESATEQQNLKSLLYNKSVLSRQYWLSGNDLPLSREFVWFGTGNLLSYTNFASGVSTNLNQRCIRTDGNFNWRREFCTSAHYFICEKPVMPVCGIYDQCNSKPLTI